MRQKVEAGEAEAGSAAEGRLPDYVCCGLREVGFIWDYYGIEA